MSSSAKSRLGQPITFAIQDEVGLYTKQNKLVEVATTQRRGLAGMNGRSVATTNAWDPAENSYAQQSFESQSKDIFKFFRQPPADLSYRNKRERRKIHAYVYSGSPGLTWTTSRLRLPSSWRRIRHKQNVSLKTGWFRAPERGSAMVCGRARMQKQLWLPNPPDGTSICLGFDGSENNDWTAIQAETFDGFSFTPRYGPDSRPSIWNPAEWEGQIPRSEVHAAVDKLFSRYRVERMYCDPQDWRTEIGEWALAHGDERVFEWATNRIKAMYEEIKLRDRPGAGAHQA